MKKDFNKRVLVAAIASVCTTAAWAANPPASSMDASPHGNTSLTNAPVDNQSMDDAKDQLESKLKVVQNRTGYATALQNSGYRISAINVDKPDYLEYEVVKGNASYEVQLDFADGATKATAIDVTSNNWRADSTEQMLKDPQYKTPTAMVVDPASRYSDRHLMRAWNDEKDQLEKVLTLKQPLDAYKTALTQRGYKITSVNDRDADSIEYEIVKGDNSYEVQIDLDPTTKLAKAVDVTSNIWEADGTDRVKNANEAKQAG